MSTLSTHILDIAVGHPAVGVRVRLERQDATHWRTIAEDVTNEDGRITAFVNAPLPVGRYRLTAAIGDWFAEENRESLFVEAQIDFRLSPSGGHYHLPFLISPWSWSTYRGS